MDLFEAKARFVQIWGTVGVEWGINRTMAQVHGLLLTSDEALTTDQVMAALGVSRGNANMNLRQLVDWGLAFRETRPKDRKEYFVAEKNMWAVAQRIVAERKRRELDPMMKMLEQLYAEAAALSSEGKEAERFLKLLKQLLALGRRSSTMLNLVLKLDESSFFKPLLALIKR